MLGGAKALYGPVLDRYLALAGPNGQLGFPVSDEAQPRSLFTHEDPLTATAPL
jgi:uncharacterized protein with LGFP repeats